jgi:hypothetical protein
VAYFSLMMNSTGFRSVLAQIRTASSLDTHRFVIASASQAIQPLGCLVAAALRKTSVPEKKMA